ncbi:MAG: methyltransferase domain-containing protein [Kiritimatiellae bacterium]|nr:methyltransferase domain-containing protein [Kiritimatiellia bacterium]
MKKIEPIDRHRLYEASVQSVDTHLDFVERVYKKSHGHRPQRLREDFCGTAKLACEWVLRHSKNRAWGIDVDKPTLEWGSAHHLADFGAKAKRVQLIHDNVLSVDTPHVDVTVAFNFSYWVFKQRTVLKEYFKNVTRSLKPGGIFVLDLFGGFNAMQTYTEKRMISSMRDAHGQRIPRFKYMWEQKSFNAITHEILCYIHFKLPDGSMIKKAYTYDWRLWTIPEIRETLLEAGFSSVDTYMHGWTKEGECDEVYRCRTFFKNEKGWLSFIVGKK